MSPGEKSLRVEQLAGFSPEVSPWIWALEDARLRTLHDVDWLDQATLDRTRAGSVNSIGTLLYHIAAVELDWVYSEVLEHSWDDVPAEVKDLLGYDVRDETGKLTEVPCVPWEEHIHRLTTSRAIVLAAFRNMPTEDFRRQRRLPDYNVSPEWVVHQLIQHEAEHRGQMMELILGF